jgi:hypothetical protein
MVEKEKETRHPMFPYSEGVAAKRVAPCNRFGWVMHCLLVNIHARFCGPPNNPSFRTQAPRLRRIARLSLPLNNLNSMSDPPLVLSQRP